jgi:hypothetical protein
MIAETLKKEYVPKYLDGERKLYRFLLVSALKKLVLIEKGDYKGILPDLELLEYYDQFIILYRREGDQIYLGMASIFRKTAHKIYRIMLKKNMTLYNPKFLNLV